MELKAPSKPTTNPKLGMEMANRAEHVTVDRRARSSIIVIGCQNEELDGSAASWCIGVDVPDVPDGAVEGASAGRLLIPPSRLNDRETNDRETPSEGAIEVESFRARVARCSEPSPTSSEAIWSGT